MTIIPTCPTCGRIHVNCFDCADNKPDDVIATRCDVVEWWNVDTNGKPIEIITSDSLPLVYVPSLQAIDLSQISTLITEQRETRRALERLIALVESWKGDGK